MSLGYEVQGAQRTLVYRLSSDEQIDQDAYGMLRNNAVEHIVGVNYKQLDNRRELRFSTEGLQSARDCFARRTFSRQQFVDILTGVADAFADAEEYMLSVESFSNSLDSTFIDERLSVSLTYVPVIGFASCPGAREFISGIRRCMQPDSTAGDLSYLNAIDRALSQADGFSVVEFKKLLASLTLKPKQSGLSSAGAGQGFAPTGDAFAGANPGLNVGVAPPPQQLDGSAFSGSAPLMNGSAPGQGGASAVAPGQPAIPPAGGAVGGINIPPAGGVGPTTFGGMAIPGMEGQQFPVGGASEKKGLFGKGGKGRQQSSGKMSRAEKKAAKEAEKAAEKAAKEAAKAAKKQKKGKSSGDGSQGGLFSRKKGKGNSMPLEVPQGGVGSAPFPIPGGSGEIPGSVPANGGLPRQVPPAGGQPIGGTPAQGQPPHPFEAQPDFPLQAAHGQGPLPGGPTGEQYNDNDFGITEVYGVTPKGDSGFGDIRPAFGSEPKPQGLPVKAYLYRESTGEKRLIDKTPFRVGRRRSEVDFHIAERPKVSRVHAVITFDGSRFAIRDNKSVNATRVNGRQVGSVESVVLVSGDSIEMGDERFRFTIENG